MKAHYLGHVVFYVKELKRSRAFYQDLLGFEQASEMKHPFKACALNLGQDPSRDPVN
jgi:catechol 2,3-dioxygenase